jgi:hypothetical protein
MFCVSVATVARDSACSRGCCDGHAHASLVSLVAVMSIVEAALQYCVCVVVTGAVDVSYCANRCDCRFNISTVQLRPLVADCCSRWFGFALNSVVRVARVSFDCSRRRSLQVRRLMEVPTTVLGEFCEHGLCPGCLDVVCATPGVARRLACRVSASPVTDRTGWRVRGLPNEHHSGHHTTDDPRCTCFLRHHRKTSIRVKRRHQRHAPSPSCFRARSAAETAPSPTAPLSRLLCRRIVSKSVAVDASCPPRRPSTRVSCVHRCRRCRRVLLCAARCCVRQGG